MILIEFARRDFVRKNTIDARAKILVNDGLFELRRLWLGDVLVSWFDFGAVEVIGVAVSNRPFTDEVFVRMTDKFLVVFNHFHSGG